MELSTSYRAVRVTRQAGVVTATLALPERQNTITPALMEELHGALDQAEADDATRIVVIQGEGGVFCNGMDFAEAAARNAEAPGDFAARAGADFLDLLKRLTSISRVVVSVVDGRVSGGGVGISAASDLVYATERSQFGLPEALWGLLPCCVLPFLMRRAGFQKAYAMTLSTQPVGARQAEASRLVDEVTDDPDAAVRRLWLRVGKVDTETIRDIKRYSRSLWSLTPETEHFVLEEFRRLMSSDVVQRRISDFTTLQKLPWEASGTGDRVRERP